MTSHGRWYCFEVSGTTEVWATDPCWAVPPRAGRTGRPRTKARPGVDTAPAQAVRDIVRALPAGDWIRHRVTEGEKGPREYEFARLRVTEKVHRAPGQAGWLLARRPVGSDSAAEIKCYLSNAPVTIALAEMAAVGWHALDDRGGLRARQGRGRARPLRGDEVPRLVTTTSRSRC